MAEPFNEDQIQQVQRFIDLLTAATREMDPRIQREKELAAAAKEQADKMKYLNQILKDRLSSSAKEFGQNLMTGGEGLGKFGGALTGATDAVGDFSKNFGIAGKIFSGFIKIFGGLASASLKQNDSLMRSYENLSRMGSVTSEGLAGLEKQLGSVGLLASEAEQLENVLKPVTKQMAQFGGSVTTGRDKMLQVVSGLIGPNNDFERGLRRLGYSVQDIREGAADFIQRQTRLGLAQGKSTAQLTKESYTYMTTLKQLQELTGMSRDEAQKALDMQLADARMSLYIQDLKNQGREGEAKNLQLYLASYKETFGEEAAAGLKEQIFNQGKIVGDLSAQAYQSTQGRAYQAAMEAAKAGPRGFLKSLQYTGEGMRKQIGQFKSTFMIAGEGVKELTGNNEQLNGAIAIAASSEKEYQKRLDELATTTGKGSERLNQNIVNEQKLRAIRVAGDQALYEAGNTVVGMFTRLNDVMFKFAKMLAGVVDKFSEVVLGKKTNLSAQFRDIEDNVQDTKEATREHASLLKQLNDAENDYKILSASNTATLKKQIDAQDKLVDDLAKKSKDKNLSELERTRAEVEWYEARRRKNLLYEQYGATRGGADADKLKQMRLDRINQLQRDLAGTQERINTLQKENTTLSNKMGVLTGVQREDISSSQTSAQTDAKLGKLLDFIGKAEGAGYNTLVGGKTTNLTEMSVQEVLDFQKTMTKEKGYISSALGKYQFINSTLSELVSKLGIDKTQKFSPELQDKLAKQLIQNSGYSEFEKGKISADQFADSLGKVWASLPDRSGRSFYANDGVNKATVSRGALLETVGSRAVQNTPSVSKITQQPGTEQQSTAPGNKKEVSSVAPQTNEVVSNNSVKNSLDSLGEKLETLIAENRKSNNYLDEQLTYMRS